MKTRKIKQLMINFFSFFEHIKTRFSCFSFNIRLFNGHSKSLKFKSKGTLYIVLSYVPIPLLLLSLSLFFLLTFIFFFLSFHQLCLLSPISHRKQKKRREISISFDLFFSFVKYTYWLHFSKFLFIFTLFLTFRY